MTWVSDNPRKRFSLEAARFGLYLIIPVGAVVIYSNPDTMRGLLNMFKFIEYPPEGPKPPSGEEIRQIMREREARRAAAAAAAAAREAASKASAEGAVEQHRRGFFSWFGGVTGKGDEGERNR